MADTFLLDLVTPERTLFSGPVQELVAPGLLGEFGVLPGHANMLAELTTGRLVYRDESGEKLMVAAGGFAEVTGERVTVLLDDAVYAEDLDRAALGKTWIKRGTKTDNLVQIAHNVVIGEDTIIVAQAGISGSRHNRIESFEQLPVQNKKI